MFDSSGNRIHFYCRNDGKGNAKEDGWIPECTGNYEQWSCWVCKRCAKEVKDYLHGKYGKAPAPVNEEIKKKIIGDDEVITCRPADLLEPEFEKLKEKYKDIARCDEDVLSLALFEQVATDFLKKKYKLVSDVEEDEFDMYI